MTDISKIIDSTNLPKQVIDKAGKLFGTLFGKGLEEFGFIIQDNIRYRRFKNQLKILSRAQELLEEEGYEAKEISLKVLVPLIDYSSLEEEPALQEKWSRLIASSSAGEDNDNITRTYAEILNRLSTYEVKILDFLYDLYCKKKLNEEEVINKLYQNQPSVEISHEDVNFDKQDVFEAFDLSENRFNYHMENLLNHGLLKWGLPEVDSGMKGFMRHIIENNRKQHNSSYSHLMKDEAKLIPATSFTFTYLGVGFVKACKFTR